MTNRRVLVTGGAGFIGSRIASTLLSDGWSVDVADNLSTGSTENIPSEARFFELDLSRTEDVNRLPTDHYDAILHLAGQSSGEKSFDNPAYDLDANSRSTVLLADWAIKNSIPALLHASSMSVYGQPETAQVHEDFPLAPLSWYGASKLAAEQTLSVASRRGLRTCSFRMFSIYGPGQDLSEMKQGMVSIFLAYVLRNDPVTVKGSLDRARDFVYIDDCVDAWRRALEQNVSGIFNLGTGVSTTVQQLVSEIARVAGKPVDYPIRVEGSTPGDQFAVCADRTRLSKQVGWEPTTDLTAGLNAMLRWAQP